MNNLERLERNEAEYAKAKTIAEAKRLDREWNAIWATMTADEKAAWYEAFQGDSDD